MSPIWKKGAATAFLAFVILWAAGILRGLTRPYPQQPAWRLPTGEVFSSRLQAANNLRQLGLATTPLPLVLDRPEVDRIVVHEKTAQLGTGTAAFDRDASRIRTALAEHEAVVFNEKNSGLVPE